MTNQLLADPPNPRAAIGGNMPPLNEQLAEELQPFRGRAADLVAVAQSAVIIDDASAAKVIDLTGLIAAVEREIEERRTALVRPHLEATRTINASFGAISGPLGQARAALKPMLSEYQRKRAAEAEEARQTALAEQRRREEEAAAAQERARATTNVGDALDALKAQEEASAAARRAEAIRAEPIRAQLGSLGAQRKIVFTVEDYRKSFTWLMRVRKTEIQLAIRELVGKQLRSMGVDAVASGALDIPGVTAAIETQAAIRR